MAFSIIIQKLPWWHSELTVHVAELTELINKLEDDFLKDGKINQQNLIDTLMYNISLINTIPDQSYPNLLSMSDTIFRIPPGDFCLAAYIPLYASLNIKFTGDRWGDTLEIYNIYDRDGFGWKYIQDSTKSFTLTAQKQNQLMSLSIWIYYPGKATIGFFENESITPSRITNLEWDY